MQLEREGAQDAHNRCILEEVTLDELQFAQFPLQSLLLKTQDALPEYRQEIWLFLHLHPLPIQQKVDITFLKDPLPYKFQRTYIIKTAQVEKKITHHKAMC